MIGFDSAFESLFGNQYALLEIAKQKLGVSDDDIRRLTLRWKQQHDQQQARASEFFNRGLKESPSQEVAGKPDDTGQTNQTGKSAVNPERENQDMPPPPREGMRYVHLTQKDMALAARIAEKIRKMEVGRADALMSAAFEMAFPDDAADDGHGGMEMG